MTVKLENEFITQIINGDISFDEIFETNLEPRWFKHNREIYEYTLNHWQQNKKLPSEDLLLTAFPYFEITKGNNKPTNIINALYKSTKNDRFITDLNRAITIYRETGDVDKSKSFLESSLNKYDGIEEKDTYDLTDEKDANLLLDFYEKRREARLKNGIVGIPTGFGPEMDNWLNGGLQNGNVYGVMAPLGVGKTWAATVIGTAALKNKKSPMFLCLEGGLEKQGYRALTVGMGIENDKLHAGLLELDEVKWTINKFRDISLQNNNARYILTFRGNRQKYTINTLWKKVAQYKPDELIVDYLGLMDNESGNNGWENQEQLANQLKNLAMAFNIPVIATYQANKSAESAEKLDKTHSSFYNVQRAWDGAFGIVKMPDFNFLIRVSDIKNRDGVGDFDAIYKTSWNKGIVEFKEFYRTSNFNDHSAEESF